MKYMRIKTNGLVVPYDASKLKDNRYEVVNRGKDGTFKSASEREEEVDVVAAAPKKRGRPPKGAAIITSDDDEGLTAALEGLDGEDPD